MPGFLMKKMFLILIGCLKRNIKTSPPSGGDLCSCVMQNYAPEEPVLLPRTFQTRFLANCAATYWDSATRKVLKNIKHNEYPFFSSNITPPNVELLEFLYHPTLLAIVYILTQSRIFLLRRNKMERLQPPFLKLAIHNTFLLQYCMPNY